MHMTYDKAKKWIRSISKMDKTDKICFFTGNNKVIGNDTGGNQNPRSQGMAPGRTPDMAGGGHYKSSER